MGRTDTTRDIILNGDAIGMGEAKTEYRFHPHRKWRFDIAWPDRRVAVEIDGGVWSGGRHTTGRGFEGDLEKINSAQALGWIVLRVTPQMWKRAPQAFVVLMRWVRDARSSSSDYVKHLSKSTFIDSIEKNNASIPGNMSMLSKARAKTTLRRRKR